MSFAGIGLRAFLAPFVAAASFALSAMVSSAQTPAGQSDFVTATMPVFSQIVRFQAPKSYVPAFSNNNANRAYIFEMIPKGETLHKWSGMVTITGQNGAVEPPPPLRSYIESFYGRFQKACPTTFSAKPIAEVPLKGHVALIVYFSCGKLAKPDYGPDGHSESVLIAFVEGAKDLYTVQWAERGAPQSRPIPFEAAKWQGRLDALRAVRLCSRVAGEAAPYPSCLAVQ